MNTNFNQVVNRKGTYSTQWDFIEERFGERDLLPFSISDTDFRVPEPVITTLKQCIEHGIYGYTKWNHDDFKMSIAKWYAENFSFSVDTSHIVYGPSVIYIIACIIQTLTEKGDYIVTQTPAYDAFYKVIKGNKRELSENKLIRKDGAYFIDFEDLENKLKHPKAKIMLLCSPHNPTGRIWTLEEIKKIISLCKDNNVYLISDEIHMDILRKDKSHSPILDVTEDKEQICLCTSASKTFNTPGLIGAYAMIPNKKLRDEYIFYIKNRDGLSSASILGMRSLMTAYNECRFWKDELNQYLDKNMEFIFHFCQTHFPSVSFRIPNATYLAWLDFSAYPFTMDELQDVLVHKYKTAIMRGSVYGTDYDKFLRLNAGCPLSKLEKGLENLKKAVSDLKI